MSTYLGRFVIPTTHEEMVQDDPYACQGQLGFTAGNISSHGEDGGSGVTLFPARRISTHNPKGVVPVNTKGKS